MVKKGTFDKQITWSISLWYIIYQAFEGDVTLHWGEQKGDTFGPELELWIFYAIASEALH